MQYYNKKLVNCFAIGLILFLALLTIIEVKSATFMLYKLD